MKKFLSLILLILILAGGSIEMKEVDGNKRRIGSLSKRSMKIRIRKTNSNYILS